MKHWKNNWDNFKTTLPFREPPYSQRNWGDQLHSLCSFYGKLKPAIAHHLITTFTAPGDRVFDCFSGSGTIPYESALLGRENFAMDVNPISIVISRAKVGVQTFEGCQKVISDLSSYIATSTVESDVRTKAEGFGFNKTLKDYFHEKTFDEILKARSFFKNYENQDDNYYLVLACMLHILHGNRPYALSRTSHPITPYAPSGEFIYKPVVSKLIPKVQKSLYPGKDDVFKPGKVFEQDILDEWHSDINDLDAIITSPPFFDSTKYHLTNWMRSWFLGWEKEDFNQKKTVFIDEKQKSSFTLYDAIFAKAKERLKPTGVVLFHLGKSKKKDMAAAISEYAKNYFKHVEIFQEDVSELEKHGIRDKGTVDAHQYLLAY